MARNVILSFGDSLMQATSVTGETTAYASGGVGSSWELARDRLANVTGIGPLLSPGLRLKSLGIGTNNPTEWTQTGSWSYPTSTDAFDKTPHGGAGNPGIRYGSGIGNVDTWTKPSWMPAIVAVDVDFIDYASGGNFQYRIDGGTWTNINQTLLHDNHWMRFRIASAVTSTIDFRGYNGTADCGVYVVAVEPYFSTATDGFVWHNLGMNGGKLNDTAATVTGDRMAVLDSVRLGTGSPVAPTPTVAVTTMYINDNLLTSASGYTTDLTTLKNRTPVGVTFAVINPWQCAPLVYNGTSPNSQADYRSAGKTAAGAGKYLDLNDEWVANGWANNAAFNSAGLVNSTDLTHQTQAGSLDIARRLYWWIRSTFFASTMSVPSTFTAKSKQSAYGYGGKLAAVQYAAGEQIAPVPV